MASPQSQEIDLSWKEFSFFSHKEKNICSKTKTFD